MRFTLVVDKGSKKGMHIPIKVDLFLVGSDPICQMRHPSLGAKHCAFITRDNKVYVSDMASGKETLVNGAPLDAGSEWPLHSGDNVAFGTLAFTVHYRERTLFQKDIAQWGVRSIDGKMEVENEERRAIIDNRIHSASAAASTILDQLNQHVGLTRGRLKIGFESGVTIIRFNIERLVDEAEIALVKKELCENLGRHNLRVLLDLKTLRKLSTQGVTMFGEFARWLRPFNSTLALCRARDEVATVLDLVNVDDIPVFADKPQAVAAKW